jgi:hypothetical protein
MGSCGESCSGVVDEGGTAEELPETQDITRAGTYEMILFIIFMEVVTTLLQSTREGYLFKCQENIDILEARLCLFKMVSRLNTLLLATIFKSTYSTIENPLLILLVVLHSPPFVLTSCDFPTFALLAFWRLPHRPQ